MHCFNENQIPILIGRGLTTFPRHTHKKPSQDMDVYELLWLHVHLWKFHIFPSFAIQSSAMQLFATSNVSIGCYHLLDIYQKMTNTLSIWINHLQLSEKLKQHFSTAENVTELLENPALKYRCIIKTEYSISHIQIQTN